MTLENKDDAVTLFLQACEDNDMRRALDVAGKDEIPAAYLRRGVKALAVTHQNYEGIGPLLVKSGVVDASGNVDRNFTRAALSSSRDPMAATLFLNGLQAKYDMNCFDSALSSGTDVCLQMVKNGNFDARQAGSRALLHAVAKGQEEVFMELMKKGADPRAAIASGFNDPRWEGAYAQIAELADKFYKAHPDKQPKSQPVSLDSAADRKEVRLSPTGDRPPARPRAPSVTHS